MVVPVFACLQRCVHDYRKYLVVSWRVVYNRRLFTRLWRPLCAFLFSCGVSRVHLNPASLELLTIVVALKLWGHLWRGLRLTVRCDNEVAVTALNSGLTALNSGRCRNAFINSCLREVCFLAATHEFEIRAVQFPGVLNSEADVLSRWNVPSRAKDQFLHRVKSDQLIAVSVPIAFFQLDSPF